MAVNNEFEREQSWPNIRRYSGTCQEKLRKTVKTAMKTVGVSDEVRVWTPPELNMRHQTTKLSFIFTVL
jgi:hypothetical protein